MSSSRSRSVLLALAGAAAACSGSSGTGLPTTALMLEVNTELRSPALTDIRVAVSGTGVKAFTESVPTADTALPYRHVVEPEGDAAGPATVDVTGLRGDAEVLRRRAVVYFLKGEIRLLRISLEAVCIGKACGAGKTCAAGGECVDPGIDVNTLPPYKPEPDAGPSQDGGPADKPVDGMGPDLPPVAPFTIDLDGVTAGDFTGPAGGAAPRIVYPLDGTMLPRNQWQMNLQFDGASHALFRVTFKSPLVDVTMHFRPSLAPDSSFQYAVPAKDWKRIAEALAGRQVTMRIAGTLAAGMPVGESAPITIEASPEPVVGGFYYFSTSLPGIVNVPWVKEGHGVGPMPFVIPNSKSNPKDCMGCHALSRDGTLVAGTYGHADDFLGIASGANPTTFVVPPSTGAGVTVRSNFQTFSADGKLLLSNFNGELILRDTGTGAEVTRVPKDTVGGRAAGPKWSHDGKKVVVTRLLPSSGMFYDVATCCGKRDGGDWLLTDAGDIVTLTFDGTTLAAPATVVAAAALEFNYYPAWSPDDRWIVFNTGTKPGFSPIAQDKTMGFSYGVPPDLLVSYDQKTSRLRLVSADGGTPIELQRASMGGDAFTSYPTFATFQQRGGHLAFITYSSKAAYGFVTKGGNTQPGHLWMAAVDLAQAATGAGDPSWSPVWMPFQDAKESNHMGVWTPAVLCATSTQCAPDATCTDNACVPRIP